MPTVSSKVSLRGRVSSTETRLLLAAAVLRDCMHPRPGSASRKFCRLVALHLASFSKAAFILCGNTDCDMPAVNMAIPIPGSIHPQAAPQSILLNSSSNPSGNGKMSIKARGKKRARIADVTNDHHHNNLEYSDATTSSSSSSSRPKVSKKKLADSNGSGPGGGRTALLPPPAQRRRSSPPIPMDASTSSSQPPITSTTTMEAASANGEGSIILGLGRGMYLSFVESALAEKDQVRPKPSPYLQPPQLRMVFSLLPSYATDRI